MKKKIEEEFFEFFIWALADVKRAKKLASITIAIEKEKQAESLEITKQLKELQELIDEYKEYKKKRN